VPSLSIHVGELSIIKCGTVGYELHWMDKRQKITPETVDFDAVEGVLCNVVTLGGLLSRLGLEQRHWFSIKKV
jgi:hypothetical protein